METGSELGRIWSVVFFALSTVLSLWASGHALIYKRDPRSATLWVGVVWLLPIGGAVLYFLLGINRIRRWAESLRSDRKRVHPEGQEGACRGEDLAREPDRLPDYVIRLARTMDGLTSRRLMRGNRVEALVNGDTAFPAMLEAIAAARETVTLATYIFDADEVGLEFARALGEAHRRGVQVRVLVDATGIRYSWPSILGPLRREGVPHARFLRLFSAWRLLTMNLRNHRKILVVDGRVGFTGGMNLRHGHWLGRHPARPVTDIHFRIEGPVVAQLQAVFAEDWQFTTGEALTGGRWFPPQEEAGAVFARGIADGPDEDFDQLRWTLLTALTAAQSSIRIATPYFLPEPALVAALTVAALRGVTVDILLPERSNLLMVHEASRALWWQVLEHGCRVWLSPPPFDHSKLMVVDDTWVFLGSANWDPRSLRLNFEFNIECYDRAFGREMGAWLATRQARARPVTLEEVDGRGLLARLRDGVARLFTPFL